MTLREQIAFVADLYCTHSGRSRARLSTLLFNDGKKLDLIASGRDLNTATFEAAMLWLSSNWPADIDWPECVARPVLPVVPAELATPTPAPVQP